MLFVSDIEDNTSLSETCGSWCDLFAYETTGINTASFRCEVIFFQIVISLSGRLTSAWIHDNRFSGLGSWYVRSLSPTAIAIDLTMANSSATAQTYIAVRDMVGLNLFEINTSRNIIIESSRYMILVSPSQNIHSRGQCSPHPCHTSKEADIQCSPYPYHTLKEANNAVHTHITLRRKQTWPFLPTFVGILLKLFYATIICTSNCTLPQ